MPTAGAGLRACIHSTIIERDPARCRVMKTLLPEATIICADGTKPDVLREEGLPEADALVTLTESDETNLIISSFAYHEKVPKIVTKVDEDNFIQLAESYGLTTIIQPADVMAGRIVEYVRWMQNSAHSSGVERAAHGGRRAGRGAGIYRACRASFSILPLKALSSSRTPCSLPQSSAAASAASRPATMPSSSVIAWLSSPPTMSMHELKDILK
ncbi:MAG: NAD-binding protein [Oscillospiraceae bacterium]